MDGTYTTQNLPPPDPPTHRPRPSPSFVRSALPPAAWLLSACRPQQVSGSEHIKAAGATHQVQFVTVVLYLCCLGLMSTNLPTQNRMGAFGTGTCQAYL